MRATISPARRHAKETHVKVQLKSSGAGAEVTVEQREFATEESKQGHQFCKYFNIESQDNFFLKRITCIFDNLSLMAEIIE